MSHPKPECIEFFIKELRTDPTQYKPYSPAFEPVSALVLRVPVEDDLIEDYDPSDGDGVIVIGLEGFQFLLKVLADTVQEVHDERICRARRINRVNLKDFED